MDVQVAFAVLLELLDQVAGQQLLCQVDARGAGQFAGAFTPGDPRRVGRLLRINPSVAQAHRLARVDEHQQFAGLLLGPAEHQRRLKQHHQHDAGEQDAQAQQ